MDVQQTLQHTRQQMLTDLFNRREALHDRLRRELQKYEAETKELGQDLDDYDKAATEMIALLTVAVEWQLLKTLGKDDSVTSFRNKFTIEELETVAFPPEFEPCRDALVKAARTVDERRKAMAVWPLPPPSDDMI